MAHPLVHAKTSARRWGGVPEDYLPIHDFLDSSKIAFPDNRHRALTHNTWFIFVVEKVFGREIDLTDGGTAKTRYVCEQHILEDFGNKFIPTVGDYFEGMEFHDWMNNGVKGVPSSHRKLRAPVKQLD